MAAPTWHAHVRAGVRLECADYGGEGAAAVLVRRLHRLRWEWDATAAWLVGAHRVVAVEQRGHGRSERRPDDVSRQAFVDDLAAWIELLGVAPAIVIGQSLGAHTAFLLAAQRPQLVRALIVAEATPAADPEAPAQVREWLASWPVPFASRADALRHFGDTGLGANMGRRPRAPLRRPVAGVRRRRDGGGPGGARHPLLLGGVGPAVTPVPRSSFAARTAGWEPSSPSGWHRRSRRRVRP